MPSVAPLRHVAAFVRNGWPELSEYALRIHDLRHTAATYMVIGGIDLVTVKEILGHATIQMTMRYAHPTPENKRHAVEVLSKLFEQPPAEANRATGQSQAAS